MPPVIRSSLDSDSLPVAVVGSGPVGLTAAAHLHARGLPFMVLEAGPEPAWGIAGWGHVRLFSPWRFLFDPVVRELLEAAGWEAPDGDELPTGNELRQRYLLPLARHPALAPHIRTGVRVESIVRAGSASTGAASTAASSTGAVRSGPEARAAKPFEVRLDSIRAVHARAVLDASGTVGSPAPLGTDGTPAPGEAQLGARAHTGIPVDPGAFLGLRTLVVGSGHTAMGAILALLREGVPTVAWGIRGADPYRYLGGGANDQLPARGAIGTRVREAMEGGRVRVLAGLAIERFEVDPNEGPVQVIGRWDTGPPSHREDVAAGTDGPNPASAHRLEVDRVIAATGYRPNPTLTAGLRLALDPVLEAPVELAPMIDPRKHSCGTVPRHGVSVLTHPDEPGYYTVGMKSYGRAPTFLMKTGYEQVRSVVARLAGDEEAATTIQMELPSTGVCRTDFVESEPCC
ncbi:MAG: flavoprotein [Gemmatimonadales bacterium]|nr:MAG: flavoprotein [Gemmatimonadales bacterium]